MMSNPSSGGVGSRMRISPAGLAIVKAFEGCLAPVPGRPGYFKPYVDPVGVLTIGYGHTNHHEPHFDSSAVWSQQQCDEVLAGDMGTFEAHVSRLAKVPLQQHEFDALVSWSFNTGGPATATLWKKLNAGELYAVPDELERWNKGGGRVLAGLTRRRKAEAELFIGDTAAAFRTAQIKGSAPVVTAQAPPPKPPPTITAEPQPQPSKWAAFFMALAKMFKRA